MIKETLPDGSIVTVARLRTEHRTVGGVLLASREPTAEELTTLADAEAAKPGVKGVWDEAIAAEAALDSHRAEIRAARLRLEQIVTQGQAAADAATGVTKVHLQATVDLAAIVLELGRVVLRDAS